MRGVAKLLLGITFTAAMANISGCEHIQFYQNRFSPHAPAAKYERQVAEIQKHGVKVIRVGDQVRFILPTDKFFEAASAEFVTPACVPVLDKIATLLQQCGDAHITVSAHTDDIGAFLPLKKRSEEQAFAVASHLWRNGIAWHRMQVAGYANDWRIAHDSSVRGSADNRRVEIRMD